MNQAPDRFYKPAAWPGLEASVWSMTPTPTPLAEEVSQLLGQAGQLHSLSNRSDHPSVFMRFDALQGEAWFLKLLDAQRGAALAGAEDLAAWLHQQGVAVVSASARKTLADGRLLWVYPFHSGCVPQATTADLVAIGLALGHLHRVLALHPSKHAWRQRTEQRIVRLNEIRARLADGRLQAGPEPLRLQVLARDARIGFEPECHANGAVSTPLHGDLNLFNMLLAEDRCTFLDFEDVCHSVLPPVFDLATVYERVVLVRGAAEPPEPLLESLLNAYAESSGNRIQPGQIPAVLRGLALRALCTLADFDPAGQDDKEWRKFFHLMDLSAPVPG